MRRFILKSPDAELPTRATKYSAGYDIRANETITLAVNGTAIISTGIGVEMETDKVLFIHIRSGLSSKLGIMLTNGVAVIDADYKYEIKIPVINQGQKPYTIEKGERIAQGIFQTYLRTDDDNTTAERQGGLGSTGKN